MAEDKKIIEINGVKLEVDLRSARRIDQFRVGDNVKVLDNRYDRNEVHSGVITDFANFKDLPTLIVAIYKTSGYYGGNPTIEFLYYNADTEEIDIVGVSSEETIISKDSVLCKFDAEIQKQQDSLNDLIMKRDTFVKYFGREQEVAE